MGIKPEGGFIYNDIVVAFNPEKRLPFTKIDILRTINQKKRKDLMLDGLTSTRYTSVMSHGDYSFGTFEILVSVCRELDPARDWNYPSIDELRAFFTPREHAQLLDFNERLQLPTHTPKVNKYLRLWEIMLYAKSQEQNHSNGGTTNATNNQQAQ